MAEEGAVGENFGARDGRRHEPVIAKG
jgi:hypothetical protein